MWEGLSVSLEELADRAAAAADDDAVELDRLALVAEAAREIQPDRRADLEKTAENITTAAIVVVPGATEAAITLVERRERSVRTLGPTGQIPIHLNQVQQQAQAGPCLTALWDVPQVHALIDTEARWPEYTAAAVELGVRQVLSLRLYVHDQDHVLGALSLYCTDPAGFDADAIAVAEAYAAHAAIAMDSIQQQDTLRQAIDTRDLIGQAKGILMERHRITPDAAFKKLVTASQHTNNPLRAVADHLVQTGELLG